jgi:hypothetical protein
MHYSKNKGTKKQYWSDHSIETLQESKMHESYKICVWIAPRKNTGIQRHKGKKHEVGPHAYFVQNYHRRVHAIGITNL